MDASEYKAKKKAANAMRRSTLGDILRIVQAQDHALAALLRANLHASAVEIPEEHVGEPEWVELSLPEHLAESVLDCLGFAEAGAVGLDGETNQEASRVAALVDAWQRWWDHAET